MLATYGQEFRDMEKMDAYQGFFNFYYDRSRDKVYLVVDELKKEFLYVHSLSSGMGHNDIGLDRGQLGGDPGPSPGYRASAPLIREAAGRQVHTT